MNKDTDSTATQSQSQVLAAGVSIKLPPYWPDDPTIWFAQVEAQFVTRGITSEQTKYSHVVASLQPQFAKEVRDILVSPPTVKPYQVLKTELMKRTSASEQKRLHQLLTAEELGDRKPSQLLRRMEQLLGAKQLEDSIFKQLFLQRLPHHVQSILASSRDDMTVNQLSELADRILEVASPSLPSVSNITAVASGSAASSSVPDIQRLSDQVEKLTFQVQSLTTQLHHERSRPRDRGTPSQRNQSRSRSFSRSRSNGLCWYHYTFGSKARKCDSPCNFTGSDRNAHHPPSQPAHAGNDKASSE